MKGKTLKLIATLLLATLVVFSFAGCSKGSSQSSTSTGTTATTTTTTTTTTTASAPASSTAKPAQNASKTITMAMVSTWDSFIPFETTSSYSDVVLDLMYDKLFYLKADGTYLPRLAESVEVNEDSTSMIFHLREDAKWADGEPVTANDVVFTVQLYSSPTVNAMRKNNCATFAGFNEADGSVEVYALDDYTVQFNLIEPTNVDYVLFNKFRDIYILPEHLLGDVPLDKIREADYWKSPIGSGPCLFQSQISGERIEFVPNPYYYQMNGNWDKFVLRVVPTGNLLAGLMNGEIDALAGNVASLQLSDWDMAKKQPNLVCESVPSLGYQYMAINTSKPYLTPAVRRAINMSINRDLMIQGLLQGEGVAAYGPVTPDNIYYNPAIEEPFNPEKAKQILAEEGWDSSRELIMSVPTGNATREQAAIIVQQNLADIGIKAKIETADFATHLNRVRAGDYDFGFIGSSGSPDPSECVINFNPEHMNNFSQLSDPLIFETGDKGGHAFDYEARKACYDEYQELLREYVPFAFLYFQNTLYAYSSRISGITDVQDYSQLNRDVWNWTINE